MSRVASRHTKPEIEVRRCLHKMGFRFRLHRRDLPGTPDIVLPRLKAVVFVHGCFWHGHNCKRGHLPATNREFWGSKIQRNKVRDCQHRRSLSALGWRVVEVWECQLKDRVALEVMLRNELT